MSDVVIERLNLRAEGVDAAGHIYPRTLPGEVVDGPRVLTPSKNRVAAPCRHFKACGGCALQHARDDFVAGWKADVIRSGLAARNIETEIRSIVTSPPQSRRRATLHGRRTKKGALVGFYARASDTLIQIETCTVLDPAILAGLPALEALTMFGASRKGEIALAVTASQAGLDIDIQGGKKIQAQELFALAALADRFDLARLSWEGEQIVMRRATTQEFGTAHVVPPPGAFLQATQHGEAALLRAVTEAIGPAKSVIDLFAGCGTFALPAARHAEVRAYENEAALIAALDAGWRQATGLKRVTAQVRDLFRRPVLPSEMSSTDAVIIDPPRAGAEAQCAELAKSNVRHIAAVSCNPVSFARDAGLLISGGYVLDWVQPVDQFRWSAHVELAALFTKRHTG